MQRKGRRRIETASKRAVMINRNHNAYLMISLGPWFSACSFLWCINTIADRLIAAYDDSPTLVIAHAVNQISSIPAAR